VLRADPTAVPLEEVQGTLQRYIQMLSGTPASVRPAPSFGLRPPLEEGAVSEGVPLPPTIDLLETWEDNARLHRVVAALVAGRRTFGTLGALDRLATIRTEEHGRIREECFLLADGYRVAMRLAAQYPGLAADLRWAGGTLVARWSGAAAPSPPILDALLALAVAQPASPPPSLASAAALVLPCLAPLASPGASAGDALVVAEILARLLALAADGQTVDPALAAAADILIEAGGAGGPSFAGEEADGEFPPLEEPVPEGADLELLLDELSRAAAAAGRQLTVDELARLLESRLGQSLGAGPLDAGLYVTQLVGKLLGESPERRPPGAAREDVAASPRPPSLHAAGEVFEYDEWDHVIGDYRPAWCRLREVQLADDAGLFFARTLERYAPLVPEIRRQFQRVQPEAWRTVRGLEDGEDFDLAAAVDARADRRARRTPSAKLYTAQARQEREVAALFLLDMSASTDEAVATAEARRRIIDIAKEALVIMAAALDEIGDAYAIYGFSGQGRQNVEVYPVKTFTERLGVTVKARIGGLQPRGSTRMGAALRHAVRTMRDVRAPARYLILLSDGFPQDLDYGQDRRSHTYGIRDTAVALGEVAAAGIRSFCITVDLAGHDYLREMCDPERYLIIDNVGDLPHELPKIYQRLVRAT
jgi:hypothetical protein